MTTGGNIDPNGVGQWDPRRALRHVDELHARLSRGFLRSRPEKWFPGFAALWLPLGHSLGVEIRLLEARPVLSWAQGTAAAYTCTMDDEPFGLFLDQSASAVIVEAVCPGAGAAATSVVKEYLARRFLTSLVASWAGPESSVIRFETELNPSSIAGVGAVKLRVEVNGNQAVVWLVMGKALTDKLDGLWRRQIRSSTRQPVEPQEVRLEVGQLAVPPAMLVEYLKPGNIIDLEIPVSDAIVLRLAGRPWLPAKMCEIGGNFGLEVAAGPVPASGLPEGATRLAIELADFTLEPSQILEVGQVGACLNSGAPLGDTVNLVINGDRVGGARLCTFEGRFAIQVM